ncbi:uncharacterized protein GLRG_01086 [Colletotrichum graminicola M1.001]|uniref:Uncharacterized protein n=1 Tax=Colletotrichum graminicola (strain M1.001 / M2 / FGSC 10212) TaxID=645133 RepID=E3Q5H5_COLGM|nr:uncharacterized protein GLRG_01086 [Colletotrichum graminicola M1.001]EFQ25942.1 hypothetical protein GLRG_01086 [Colletotrichum graminicola M1.001]
MSTISAQDKKPPSAGTKVDLGAAAPTRPESPGPVPADSLAAESASHGGEFAKNRGVDPNTLSSGGNDNGNSSSPRTGTGAGAAPGSGGASSKAEPAPTYVLNQYIRDPKGPHGKNIHEGIDDQGVKDGVQEAFRAEPGSENDPARVAERELLKSQTRAGRDAGPRETEISGQTVFERLDNDVQA